MANLPSLQVHPGRAHLVTFSSAGLPGRDPSNSNTCTTPYRHYQRNTGQSALDTPPPAAPPELHINDSYLKMCDNIWCLPSLFSEPLTPTICQIQDFHENKNGVPGNFYQYCCKHRHQGKPVLSDLSPVHPMWHLAAEVSEIFYLCSGNLKV